MQNPLIEKQKLAIHNNRAREYFDEVLIANSGSYSSAIVMLYVTVIADFVHKLDELTTIIYKDAGAAKILKDVEDEHAMIDK